ncbi:MAG TPA: CRISPR-associated protein Cas4 [Acidimicrobiales bacterium]|nr:CRISPR-associated protein Cas4 [Acidimicrobiales bacterium]
MADAYGPNTVSPGEVGHFVYCPRSWAIIATERLWSDNRHTAAGHVAHARVDEDSNGHDSLFHVTVWSDQAELYGVADRVDLAPSGPLPVEYKSARHVQPDHRAQLSAQAICLEEMFGVEVVTGAIWLTKARRKVPVVLSDIEKREARNAAAEIRSARSSPRLPAPVNDRRCADCSLKVHCLPEVVADRRRLSNLHASLFVPPT